MNNKLFVGSLPFRLTEQEFADHFAQAGQVLSAKIILDKATGRSKGFGFVEMGTPEEAEKAISMLNGSDLGGRAVSVDYAKPMESRAPRQDGAY
ncbi:MAG TPA: RNA-binding protein [Candidatus Paceibacterota bacterium]|nr:RNA-binding protein [Candidatus Paceibacterota bacterium]